MSDINALVTKSQPKWSGPKEPPIQIFTFSATSLSDSGADKPSVEHAENIGYNIGKQGYAVANLDQ